MADDVEPSEAPVDQSGDEQQGEDEEEQEFGAECSGDDDDVEEAGELVEEGGGVHDGAAGEERRGDVLFVNLGEFFREDEARLESDEEDACDHVDALVGWGVLPD